MTEIGPNSANHTHTNDGSGVARQVSDPGGEVGSAAFHCSRVSRAGMTQSPGWEEPSADRPTRTERDLSAEGPVVGGDAVEPDDRDDGGGQRRKPDEGSGPEGRQQLAR